MMLRYFEAKGHCICNLLLNCGTEARTITFVIRDRKRESDGEKVTSCYQVVRLSERYAAGETIISVSVS